MGPWLTRLGYITALILLLYAATPMRTGSLNIDRGDYDVALAKWNSLHVAEYEETVGEQASHSSLGNFKMVVDVDYTSGNAVETVAQIQKADGSAATAEDMKTAQGLTVGALFKGVDELLCCPVEMETINPVTSYTIINFDPPMGYPRSFTFMAFPVYNTPAPEGYTGGLLSVDELKVIK